MGINFDILEHCRKVRADHGPPYNCPLENCDRTYKSVCGLSYHLKSFDHNNPSAQTPTPTQSKNKRGRARIAATPQPTVAPVLEPLTYNEAQKSVQVEVDGQTLRISINEMLDVHCKDTDNSDTVTTEMEKPPETVIKLPEASFKMIEDYNICDAPPRPNAFIRFIEKSPEELDGEVEYDVDEEDSLVEYN